MKPKVKNTRRTIDILCGLGVVKRSFGLVSRSAKLWGATLVQWVHVAQLLRGITSELEAKILALSNRFGARGGEDELLRSRVGVPFSDVRCVVTAPFQNDGEFTCLEHFEDVRLAVKVQFLDNELRSHFPVLFKIWSLD